MSVQTGWDEWPFVERQAGAEMNETFWGKFYGRHRAQRARPKQPIALTGSRTVIPSYQDISATSMIWVPPWAAVLTMNVLIAIDLLLDGTGGDLYVRSRIGGSFGQELIITEVPYGPGFSNDGIFLEQVLYHDVSAIAGVEDVFTYQMKKRGFPLNSDVQGGQIAPRDPWSWVEFLP